MKMILVWIAVLAMLAWPVLQIFVWLRWRGAWRIIASAPVLVGVGGCIYYIFLESNLWPFWMVIIAPFSTAFLLLLWGAHFMVARYSR